MAGTTGVVRSAPSNSTRKPLRPTLEQRLAPIVGLLVVSSLLLGGGYLFVVTVW